MIVRMKKAKLIFFENDKNTVLELLQLYSLMMLDSKHVAPLGVNEKILKTSRVIAFLDAYLPKKSSGNNAVVTGEEFSIIDKNTIGLIDEIDEDIGKYKAAKEELNKYEDKIKLISPFKDLPFTMERAMRKSLYLKTVLGKIASDKQESLFGQIQSLDLVYEILSEKDGFSYIAVTADADEEGKLKTILEQGQFQIITLPPLDRTNGKQMEEYEAEIRRLEKEISVSDDRFRSVTAGIGAIKLAYDQLQSEENRHQVTFLSTRDTYYLEGWIRIDQIDCLKETLAKKNIVFELELRDPLEDELVPTALKNNKFVRSFETITNQFSVPSYKEIDPNPSMSVWYWLIFGIMMGDMGYGLLMIIIFGLLTKFGKLRGEIKNLAKVFMLTGITSLIAGALFGSLFGFSVLTPLSDGLGHKVPILDPINDPLPMLVISLALGIMHIIHALILKFILAIRKKDLLGGLSDAMSWILILLGISVFAVNMALKAGPVLDYVSLSFIGIGVLLIIILSGRNQKNILSKAVSAFGGLYGAASYLSDILSYSRILALALSSGVIAMTFNILGGMVLDSVPVLGILLGLVVYLAGHVFNFVMGLLSAYVHAGRLQYLEFYGKFYEGGGYMYEPLSVKLKYVYEVRLKQ